MESIGTAEGGVRGVATKGGGAGEETDAAISSGRSTAVDCVIAVLCGTASCPDEGATGRGVCCPIEKGSTDGKGKGGAEETGGGGGGGGEEVMT